MPLPTPKESSMSELMQHHVQQGGVLKIKERKQLSKGNTIIEKAQKAAKLTTDETQKKKEKILVAAEKERAKGFKSGYEKGKQEAVKEGLKWLMQVNEIKSFIFGQVRDQIIDTIESVLMHTLENVAPNWMKEQLEKVLGSLEATEEVEIHASELYISDIKEIVSLGQYKGMHISVVSDPEEHDSCFVRTRYFEAEFSLTKLRESIIDVFHIAFEETKQ